MHFLCCVTERPKTPGNFFTNFFTAIVNQIYTLACHYNINLLTIFNWAWWFNGGPLPGNVITEIVKGIKSEMKIKGAQMYNAGIYTCTAYSGDIAAYTRSMTLAVIGEWNIFVIILLINAINIQCQV